jgi:septin family protein
MALHSFDQGANSFSFAPIVQYIEAKYDAYLADEKSQLARNKIVDNRVHALLYFLPPTGKMG